MGRFDAQDFARLLARKRRILTKQIDGLADGLLYRTDGIGHCIWGPQ